MPNLQNSPSEEIKHIDKAHHWHPYTRFSSLESSMFSVMVRGEGPYLYDAEGRQFIDAIASWWANDLGHSRDEIITAVTEQFGVLQHAISGGQTNPAVAELSYELAHLFSDPKRHVLYASDGACAIEAALKIALQYRFIKGQKGKNRFATIKDGYHGDTLGAVSVGFVKGFHAPFEDFITKAFTADNPYCADCEQGSSPETCTLDCFNSMREILTSHHKEITAVILEPLCQGSAGMRLYSPRYLMELSALCQSLDVLLIVDEIATGYGRTGKMFAFEHADINPDIVCIGKGVTSGTLPLSAAIVKDYIWELFSDKPVDNTFYHGHTHAGNPVACKAALAVLALYKRDSVVEIARKNGELLATLLAPFKNYSCIRKVRSLGMIGAFDIEPGLYIEGIPAPLFIRQKAFDAGVLIRPLGDTIYLMPPLVLQESILKKIVGVLADAVIEIEQIIHGE